jgi:MerR family copper efflux transcriptional regulator
MTGLSVKTLHYYEERGLAGPTERTEAGHRLYGEDELARLIFIARAKRLGLSLEEISELLEYESEGRHRRTRDNLKRLMVAKLEELHRELDELALFGAQLEVAYARLSSHPPYEPCTPDCDCPPDIRNDQTLTRYGSVRSRVRLTGEHGDEQGRTTTSAPGP